MRRVGSYIPLIILNSSIISPRYRLYLSVGNFKAFNRSRYDFLNNSGINFVALFCAHSNLSTSIFLLGYHTLLAYSKYDITRDEVTKQFLEMFWSVLHKNGVNSNNNVNPKAVTFKCFNHFLSFCLSFLIQHLSPHFILGNYKNHEGLRQCNVDRNQCLLFSHIYCWSDSS